MNGLLELLTNKHWMIHPDFVQAARPMIQQNLNGHIALVEEKKVMATAIPVAKSDSPSDIFQDSRISVINGRPVYSWDDEHKDDPFINLMYVDGPITRNGGACTYGSVELRDIMMRAADDEHCVGHIFFINTPGGSAWAKNDFQQAIDYAHERRQPVNAFIDGMCCSAGMYLASMCDERYYMHPKDQIGCIGVMAAFYTEADGSKNEYTNETYHELYDPESFDKNREMRDIANDGKDELLIEELTKLGVEFRADITAACPKAKKEHLHGKVFDAADVKGILMDGQMNLSEVFDRTVKMGKRNGVAALAQSSATGGSVRMTAGAAKAAIQQEQNQAGLDSAEREQARPQVKEALFNPLNNSINMKEKFPQVFALLGVEEMECNEEGSFLNASLLETLNGKIAAMQQESAQAKELAESLTKQVDELKAAHEQAISDLNAGHAQTIEEKDKAIADMEAAHKEAIEAKDAEIATLTEQAGKTDEALKAKDEEIAAKAEQIETLTADLNGAKESLATAEQTIAERDQQISDLNAQITELTTTPGNEPAAGAAPQNNGGGAEVPVIASTEPVAKKGQTYDEMRETWDGKE